ncbi:MAG: GNAT family N-acetyltransferase [Deltaproteobacteria bacterium]|nr:GNAT family N-acetyltransferase [Deltaproteobacteria bacterium]
MNDSLKDPPLSSASHRSVNYRLATARDIEEIISFWHALEGGIFLSAVDSIASLTRFFERNPELSYLATAINGKIIGTILCGHDGLSAHIYHMAVDKSFRRQGIGSELVRQCLDSLLAIDIRICHLGFTDKNIIGREFWTSLGWQERSGFKLLHRSLIS